MTDREELAKQIHTLKKTQVDLNMKVAQTDRINQANEKINEAIEILENKK